MNISIIKKLTFILIFFSVFAVILSAEIIFSQSEWDMEKIEKGDIKQITLTVTNNDSQTLNISFISTCDCVTVDNVDIVIAPGETSDIVIQFDSRDDSGEFEKIIIIRGDAPGLEKVFFFISGEVISDETVISETISTLDTHTTGDVELDFYYPPGCRSCIKFLNTEIPDLEKRLDIVIKINRFNILEPAIFDDFQNKMSTLGINYKSIPVLVLNKTVLQGDHEIKSQLETLLLEGADFIDSTETESKSEGKVKLFFLPVISAGLLDGINPCAFTTLIFLLAALATAGKGKKEVLIIGIFFSFSVFITYFMIGLGFFGTLRFADSFSIISDIIRWILFSILIIFTALSIRDYFIIRGGNPGKILLQLPMSMKKRIHKSVRTYTRSTALIGSSIIMGFFVSVFELGCTGQIYFPTIAYLVQVEKEFTGYILLAVYNIGFIIPLLLVFVFTYTGVSSDKITKLFQRNMGKVKIGTAVLFLSLAVLTILT